MATAVKVEEEARRVKVEGRGSSLAMLMDGGEGAASPCHGGGRLMAPWWGMDHRLELDTLLSMPIPL
jgi:hypothetical protein